MRKAILMAKEKQRIVLEGDKISTFPKWVVVIADMYWNIGWITSTGDQQMENFRKTSNNNIIHKFPYLMPLQIARQS